MIVQYFTCTRQQFWQYPLLIPAKSELKCGLWGIWEYWRWSFRDIFPQSNHALYRYISSRTLYLSSQNCQLTYKQLCMKRVETTWMWLLAWQSSQYQCLDMA